MEQETHAAQYQEKGEYPFIEKVFNSFKVDDASITSRTFFENKFSIFEEDLNSEHDSIRYSAIKSFNSNKSIVVT